MNLLEINAGKLCEILRTSSDKGLSERQVTLNRREFAPETKHRRLGFGEISKTVFGNVMLVLFFLLSFFALDVRGDRTAGVCVGVFLVFYFLFQLFSALYVRKAEEKIHPYRRSVCLVIRDGKKLSVDYSDLVPGDIILLEEGDIVPCDALVLEQKTLRVLEVQLTGNTSPVVKLTQEDVLSTKGCPYYECILFAGSVVSFGQAKALVCNVGNSIFDKKNKLVSRVKSDNRPKIYEKAVTISDRISLVWIIFSVFVVITGIIRGEELFSLFYTVTALSVAILPDIILTLSELNLATSTLRLMKKGAVVKNLSSIDRMCDINCIAVDSSKYFRASNPKPHTVIVGEEKKRFKNAQDRDVRELFELACIACAGDFESGMDYNGISVEKTLLDTAQRLGMPQSQLYEKYLLLEKMPFRAENGMSRVIVFREGKFYLVCLGIPEYILRASSMIRRDGIDKSFYQNDKMRLLEDSRLIASDNEGMVAVCIKEIAYREGAQQIENPRGSSFIGFIGLHTAIRSDAAKAVSLCDRSGIDILLMTNEPRATSLGFADSLAIMKSGERMIDAKEFDEIDEGLFRADIKQYKLFLSLKGDKKGKIVRFRKSDGDIVASTASSIEDIPLQLESDVSFCLDNVRQDAVVRNSDVVMISGIDVLLDCIKYARCVYRNIRHMLEYLMLSQFTLASVALMFMIFLPKISFAPVQIIMYSLFVFLPITFVLSNERVRGTELKSGFGEENVNINFQNLITLPLVCGLTSGLITVFSARLAMLSGATEAVCRGLAFITLSFTSVLMAYSVSSDSTLSFRMFNNRLLNIASPIVIALSLLFVCSEGISHSLDMAKPEFKYILIALGLSILPTALSFGIKLVKKYVFNNFKE
jgi:Ca2+-transporting ATPase